MTPGGDLGYHQLDPPSCRPSAITMGPDGALWLTLSEADAIGRITTAGEVRAFPVATGSKPFGMPAPSSEPYGLTIGTDGAVYAALESGAVARLAR